MIEKIVLFIIAIGLFCTAAYVGVVDKEAAVVTALGALALGVLCFAFLSKFKKFKGWGFEGETWENVQYEAQRIVKDLRHLAVVVATPLSLLSARSGTWGFGLKPKEMYEAYTATKTVLEKNAVSPEEIEKIVRIYHDRFSTYFCSRILIPIRAEADKTISVMRDEIGKNFKSPISDHNGYNQAMQALHKLELERKQFGLDEFLEGVLWQDKYKKLIRLLDETECLTPFQKEEIKKSQRRRMEDLEYYCRTGEILNLQDFLSMEDWEYAD